MCTERHGMFEWVRREDTYQWCDCGPPASCGLVFVCHRGTIMDRYSLTRSCIEHRIMDETLKRGMIVNYRDATR